MGILTYLKWFDKELAQSGWEVKLTWAAFMVITVLKYFYPDAIGAMIIYFAPIFLLGLLGLLSLMVILLLICFTILKISGRPLKRRSRTQE